MTNEDSNGNNSCHFAFEINDLKTRYKFLKLLLEERVGDVTKANIIGLIPHEIEHEQPLPLEDLPKEIQTHFPTTMQEI